MKRIIALLLVMICVVLVFVSCQSGKEADNGSYGYSEYENNSEIVKMSYSSDADIQQKLIKTVKISAETKDYDGAVKSINDEILNAGGYIESQESYGNSYGYEGNRRITLTVRIPVEKFDEFTGKMDGLLNVTSVSSSVENVTEEYYDVDARLATVKAERESLLAMMESLNEAEDYAFWSELFKQISSLEKEIASYEATIRNFDSKITYSTVGISLVEVKELTTDDEPSFGERLGDAFVSGWVDFAEGWKDFAVGFVGAFPTLLVVFGIPAGIFCAIFFPLRNAAKKKRQAKDGKK